MLAYAAAEHFDQRLFRSIITIASPAFTAIKHPLVDQLHRLKFMLHLLPWLPNRQLAQLGSLFPGLVRKTMGHIVANPENMDTKHIGQLLRGAQSNLPAQLMTQFAEWYGGPPGFKRHDGLFDYYEHMRRIKAPMLVVAGAGDELTPVADIASVFESIGSPDKKFLVCGKHTGFTVDYGHIDLVLGIHARREVYPHLSAWIEQHP
jgi:hypothetical protein